MSDELPPAGPTPTRSAGEAWRRLIGGGGPGRLRRGTLVVALLCAALGFGLATQVRSQGERRGALVGARQEDLVAILDDLNNRSDRLRAEITELQQTRRQLLTGSDSAQTALEESRKRARTLGVLAGTLPATGPGIVLTITDPQRTLPADVLLDTVEELRDAGAEAFQLDAGPVHARIVADTYFTATDAGPAVDGNVIDPPYRFTVIGDPRTLASALDFPGGVLETVRRSPGADGTVVTPGVVSITALRPLDRPQYAQPAPAPSASRGG